MRKRKRYNYRLLLLLYRAVVAKLWALGTKKLALDLFAGCGTDFGQVRYASGVLHFELAHVILTAFRKPSFDLTPLPGFGQRGEPCRHCRMGPGFKTGPRRKWVGKVISTFYPATNGRPRLVARVRDDVGSSYLEYVRM